MSLFLKGVPKKHKDSDERSLYKIKLLIDQLCILYIVYHKKFKHFYFMPHIFAKIPDPKNILIIPPKENNLVFQVVNNFTQLIFFKILLFEHVL